MQKEYKGRFRKESKILIAIYAIAVLAYGYMVFFYEDCKWTSIFIFIAFGANIINIWMVNKFHKVIVNRQEELLQVKPGYKKGRDLKDMTAIEIIRGKSGVVKYLSLKFGKYDFVRVYVEQPQELIADILDLRPDVELIDK